MNKRITKAELIKELETAQERLAEMEKQASNHNARAESQDWTTRYKTFIEQSRDGIVLFDENGYIRIWNSAQEKITGIPQEEAINQAYWDVQYRVMTQESKSRLTPDFLKQALLNRIKTGEHASLQKPMGVEIQNIHGARKFIETSAFSITTESGYYIGAITRDITDQKKIEILQRENAQLFSQVFQASPAQMAITDLVTGKYINVNPKFLQTLGFTEDEVIGKTASELGLFFDASQRSALLEKMGGMGFLQNEDVVVRTKNGELRHGVFSAEYIQVQGQQFLLTVMNDITERKKTEEKLREKEHQYRTLIESLDISLSRWLPDSTLTFANDKYRNIFGIQGDAAGQKWLSFLPEETRSTTTDFYQEVMKNPRIVIYEQPVTMDGGNVRHFQWTDTPIFDADGAILEFQSTGVDITEQKAAEETLRKSESRLKSFLEAIPDAMVIANREGRIILANEQTEKVFGYSGEELTGMNVEQLIPEDSRSNHIENRANFMSSPKFITTGVFRDIHALRKDGSEFPVEVSLSHHQLGDELIVLSTIRDITERRQAEDRLSKNRQRLSEALEIAKLQSWTFNLETRMFEVQEGEDHILGWEAGSYGLDIFIQLIVPEDIEFVASAWMKAVKGEPLDAQFRIQVDGENKWVHAKGKMVYDRFGQPVSLLGVTQDITEQKLTENALRSNQEILKDTQQMAKIQNWMVDFQNSTLTVGPGDGETLGWETGVYKLEEMRSLIHPADQSIAFSAWEYAAQGGSILDIEHRILLNGEIKWIHAKSQPSPHNPDQKKMLGFAQDITERKHAEELMTAQRDLARLISSITDYAEALPRCLETALRVSGMDSGGIYLFNAAQQILELVYHQGLKDDFVQAVSQYSSDTPGAQMILGGTMFYLTEDDLQNQSHHKSEGLRSLAAIPILDHGHVLGCMNIASHTLPYVPEAARKAIETITTEIGTFIAHLHTESLLRESEEKYRSLIDSQESAISTIDANGVFHYINRIGAAPLADVPEKVIGKKLQEMFPPEIAGWQLEQVRAVISSGNGLVKEYQTMLGGKASWRRVSIQPIQNASGQVTLAMVNSLDITDRKQAEESLRESEARAQAMLRAIPDLMFRMDQHGMFLDYKADIKDLYASPGQSLIGMRNREVTPPEFADLIEQKIQETLETGTLQTFEYQLDIPNKGLRDFEARMTPSGVQEVIAVVRDISEQKQSENALQESEAKYRLLAENISDVIWILDLHNSQYLYVSPSVLQLRGYNVEEVKLQDLTSSLTSASAQYLLQILPPRIENARKGNLTAYTDEIEQPCKDGGTVWTETTTRILVNPENGHLEVYGVSRNIAERKKAEAAIRQIEKRNTALIENAPDGIALVDSNGIFKFASPSAYRMFGYGMDEILNSSSRDKMHPDDVGQLIPLRQKLLGTPQKPQTLEYRFLHKDGTYHWLESTYTNMFDEPSVAGIVINFRDITGRKIAEAALRASEEKYRGLMESLDSVVATVDADGRFLYMNDVAADQIGGTAMELTGKTMWDLFPMEVAAPQMEAVQDVMREDKSRVFEALSFVNGVSRWYRTFIQPIHGDNGRVEYALINSTDINDLKTAQKELQDLNRTLEERVKQRTAEVQDLYENAPNGYHSIDADGIILMINQTELNWIGYTRGEVTGHPMRDFLTKKSMEFFEKTFDVFKQGGEMSDVEIEMVCKDGTILPVSLSATAIRDPNGNFLMSRSTLFDITERKKADLALRESSEELSTAYAALEKASRAKDEFLANMSHELRTPLNGILGLAEILLSSIRGPINEHQTKLLQTIDASGRHLLGLINDILDLSKIEAGKLEILPENIIITDVCNSSLAFVKEMCIKKGITLDFQNKLPISSMQADPRRLKQILVNLLSNAVKFTASGGRVTLEVRANFDMGFIEYSVIDNGIGITSENLQRLFTPFVQVDSSLSRQYEGTGLGLALVKRLTEMHGGRIAVTSVPGEGSKFTASLPWQDTSVASKMLSGMAEADPAPSIIPSTTVAVEPGSAGTILLAEDAETNIILITDYMEYSGYTVVVAHNGQEALDKAAEYLPDIILMDIQMPVMDGLEAIKYLRADPRFAHTPIIALTALAMIGDQERCIAAGANEYLSKPFNLNNLAQMIGSLIKK